MSMQRSRSQDSTIWSGLCDRLRLLTALQTRSISNLKQVNILQGDVQNEREPFGILRPKLERAYSIARNDVSEEEKLLKEVLEQLSILIALRSNPEPPAPAQEKRKKRRIDAGSPTPTPSERHGSVALARESSRASPAPGSSSSRASAQPSVRTPSVKPAVSSSLSKDSSSQGAPVSSKPSLDAAPIRKPRSSGGSGLAEGRAVAFRPPSKPYESEREGWILTKVLRYLGQDKYEVQDIEDEENGSPGAIFPATSKQLVVLPDRHDPSTYPLQPYPGGAEVMALYPDTTTFYHAKVVMSLPKKDDKEKDRKGGNYKVIFDDDNGVLKSVAAEKIALWPR